MQDLDKFHKEKIRTKTIKKSKEENVANDGRCGDSIDSLLGKLASLLLDASWGNVKVVLFPMCIEHKVVGISRFNKGDGLVAVFMDELKGPLVSTKAAKQEQNKKIPSLEKFIAFTTGRDGWVYCINKAAKDSDYRMLNLTK